MAQRPGFAKSRLPSCRPIVWQASGVTARAAPAASKQVAGHCTGGGGATAVAAALSLPLPSHSCYLFLNVARSLKSLIPCPQLRRMVEMWCQWLDFSSVCNTLGFWQRWLVASLQHSPRSAWPSVAGRFYR